MFEVGDILVARKAGGFGKKVVVIEKDIGVYKVRHLETNIECVWTEADLRRKSNHPWRYYFSLAILLLTLLSLAVFVNL